MKFNFKCRCGAEFNAEDEHDRPTDQYNHTPAIHVMATEFQKEHANCLLFPKQLSRQQVDTLRAAAKLMEVPEVRPVENKEENKLPF